MEILDRFDYETFGIESRWYVEETIKMLTCFEMENKGYFSEENSEEISLKIRYKYSTYLTDIMVNGKLQYVTPQEDYDSLHTLRGEISKHVVGSRTNFDSSEFLKCVEADNKANIDIQKLRKYLSGEEVPKDISSIVETESEVPEASSRNIGDIEDNKYPDFKGVKFNKLTNEQFTEIKQFYGIVKNEESKLRRAIPIAVKIGLLFYERNLEKPTTRPAFLEAYKVEFDAILKNDVLAKEIYRNLPEEYRGGRSVNESGIDMLGVIRAAVYAGSIFDTDDVKDLEALKVDLAGQEYRLPSDDILVKIIEATKDI